VRNLFREEAPKGALRQNMLLGGQQLSFARRGGGDILREKSGHPPCVEATQIYGGGITPTGGQDNINHPPVWGKTPKYSLAARCI